MKVFTQKIAAFLLACLVLFSTMSMTVGQHFCGDVLVDSSVFGKADSCGMEMSIIDGSVDVDCSGTNMEQDCCKDVVSSFGGNLETKMSTNEMTFNQQAFLAFYVYSYINLYESLKKNIIPFKDYLPPILIWDINVLNEIFLI